MQGNHFNVKFSSGYQIDPESKLNLRPIIVGGPILQITLFLIQIALLY